MCRVHIGENMYTEPAFWDKGNFVVFIVLATEMHSHLVYITVPVLFYIFRSKISTVISFPNKPWVILEKQRRIVYICLVQGEELDWKVKTKIKNRATANHFCCQKAAGNSPKTDHKLREILLLHSGWTVNKCRMVKCQWKLYLLAFYYVACIFFYKRNKSCAVPWRLHKWLWQIFVLLSSKVMVCLSIVP